MKKQQGFTIVEVLVVIIIIGLVGGAAWYVGHRSNQSKASPNSSKTSASTDGTTGASKATIEQGNSTTSGSMIVYENTSLGVGFTYPASWGKVTVASVQLSHGIGQAESLTFSNLSTFRGGLIDKTYQEDSQDASVIGFTSYDACGKTDASQVAYRLFDGTGVCVAAIAAAENDPILASPVATLTVEKQLTKSAFAGVEFTDTTLPIADKTEASIKKVYTSDKTQVYVDFAKTIKEL